jgi:hypothetical protein
MGHVFCRVCGRQLDELAGSAGAGRMPCPDCGSTSRHFEESCNVSVGLRVNHSLLHQRDNKAIGFEESRQGVGLSAQLSKEGALSYKLTGNSPQGEEDTLQACRILVAALNKAGGGWDSPTIGAGVIDCQAANRQDSEKKLHVQIVRANVDTAFWRALQQDGKVEGDETPEQLAKQIKLAIDAKANHRKIPRVSRRGLTLALDATRLPALSFNTVVKAFRSQWGPWARTLGFDGVWLVGPSESLTWRLDPES